MFAILYRYRNLWDRLLGSRCQLISTDMPVSTMSYYSLSLSLTLAASPAAAASLSIICQSCFPKQVLLWSWPFIEYQVGQPASCSRVASSWTDVYRLKRTLSKMYRDYLSCGVKTQNLSLKFCKHLE